jgi:hypothetical protein
LVPLSGLLTWGTLSSSGAWATDLWITANILISLEYINLSTNEESRARRTEKNTKEMKRSGHRSDFQPRNSVWGDEKLRKQHSLYSKIRPLSSLLFHLLLGYTKASNSREKNRGEKKREQTRYTVIRKIAMPRKSPAKQNTDDSNLH